MLLTVPSRTRRSTVSATMPYVLSAVAAVRTANTEIFQPSSTSKFSPSRLLHLQCCVTSSVWRQSSWSAGRSQASAAPAVLCDANSVVAEFMVSRS
jgi:hypothetical protein